MASGRYYDEKYTIAKGDACEDKIKVREKGAVRITQQSEKKALIEFKEWSYGKFHNPKTHRSIEVGNGGDLYEKLVSDDKVKGKMRGEKFAYGEGVYGIAYAKGVAKYNITELDQKLGTLPVEGSNPDAD